MTSTTTPYIRWFSELGIADVPLVGGKNASLGEMLRELGAQGVRVPNGFAVAAQAYRYLLDHAGAWPGLHTALDGLEVYVMCEIPNNVLQIDAFARLFDGFSIGSNDLTQLVLGVDRDSDIVAFDFDERDPGVKEMIRQTIAGAHRNQRHVGICGQAPSDYPEIAQYLVELGIDAMSVTPDTLLKITVDVLAMEARLGRAPRSAARPSSLASAPTTPSTAAGRLP